MPSEATKSYSDEELLIEARAKDVPAPASIVAETSRLREMYHTDDEVRGRDVEPHAGTSNLAGHSAGTWNSKFQSEHEGCRQTV